MPSEQSDAATEQYNGYGPSPWKDEDLMRELYHGKRMSANDIKKEFGCALATITKWLDKHDSIDKRTRSQASRQWHVRHGGVAYYTMKRGHETWKHNTKAVYVHRLQAVAEFGFDAVVGHHVHHINGIPWDNRPENLELVTNENHQRKHLKIDGIDRIRVAELYENGDISSRGLAEMFDVCNGTILRIHKEFYGGEADAA